MEFGIINGGYITSTNTSCTSMTKDTITITSCITIYHTKIKHHLSVCLSALFVMLITQPCQHGLKQDLLKMKAVSLMIKILFLQAYRPTVHRQEYLKDEHASRH